jgi:hypothetical protein
MPVRCSQNTHTHTHISKHQPHHTLPLQTQNYQKASLECLTKGEWGWVCTRLHFSKEPQDIPIVRFLCSHPPAPTHTWTTTLPQHTLHCLCSTVMVHPSPPSLRC